MNNAKKIHISDEYAALRAARARILAKSKFKPTAEQQAAIDHSDGNSQLVSAAAGSGKSTVLIDRLMRNVTCGIDIDEFLVITFTKAAALELKEKIQEKIRELQEELESIYNEGTDEEEQDAIGQAKHVMRRQLMLCKGAYIGTIHSFCGEILREYAHEVELSPNFRIADEKECDRIKGKALNTVLLEAYKNIDKNEGFKNLIDFMLDKRDDKKLEKIVLDVFSKLQSHDNPEKWLQDQKNELDEIDKGVAKDIAETKYGIGMLEYTQKRANYCKEVYKSIQSDIEKISENFPTFVGNYTETVESAIKSIGNFCDAIDKAIKNKKWPDDLEFSFSSAGRARKTKEGTTEKEIEELTKKIKELEKKGKTLCKDDLDKIAENKKELEKLDDPRGRIKNKRNECNGEIDKCVSELNVSSKEHLEDMRNSAPAYKALFDLVIAFGVEYSKRKRALDIVDYSDLEHKTLELLVKKDGSDSKVANSISERFHEIMVDEYQDVNRAQDRIFEAVSKGSKNIFMVGDVKQSIYRFRLADPKIFIKKMKHYRKPEGAGDGKIQLLSKNFRSSKAVVDVANDMFSNMMSKELGEIDYDDKDENENPMHKLVFKKCGNDCSKTCNENDEKKSECVIENKKLSINDEGSAEIIFLNMADNEGDKDEGNANLDTDLDEDSDREVDAGDDKNTPEDYEGDYIACRINEIIEEREKQVKKAREDAEKSKCEREKEEAEKLKEYTYSDFVVLFRGMKKTWRYARQFKKIGIPVENAVSQEFFDSIEISTILSLLEVIDNRTKDIFTAALLTGPLYNFTADDIAKLRMTKWNTLYMAAKKHEVDNSGNDEEDKYIDFINDIEEYTSTVGDYPIDKFIWHIYNKTNIFGIVSGLKDKEGNLLDGEHRVSNLKILADVAVSCVRSGNTSLYDFLELLRDLKENDNKPEDASGIAAFSSGSNAVRFMTMHKSKGLEFPVVFVAGTAGRFNTTDLRETMLFHKDYGVGSKLIDRNLKVRHTTLAREMIAGELKREMYSEEMRLLYVAVTRAEHKVIIIGTFRNLKNVRDRVVSRGVVDAGGKISPQWLLSLNSPAEWLIAAYIEYLTGTLSDDMSKNLTAGNISKAAYIKYLTKELSDDMSNDPTAGNISKTEDDLKKNDEDKYAALRSATEPEALNYKYQYAVERASKQTVTASLSERDTMENTNDAEVADYAKNSHSDVSLDDGDIVEVTVADKIDKNRSFIVSKKPKFITGTTKLTAAERGTMVHSVMEFIDFEKCGSEDGVREELERLHSEGYISEQEKESIANDYIKGIVSIFNSDLGGRMLSSENSEREFRFSMLDKITDNEGTETEDNVLTQGIIDYYFEDKSENIVIVDFKTDNVKGKDKDKKILEKVETYTPQLKAYANALERITKKNVTEGYLCLLQVGESAKVI